MDQFLDSIDLFVLASRTEGLPRAMVEAMARGCPAIGSAVGGIPELLQPADLVEPGCVERLAAGLIAALRDPDRLMAMARRNHGAALDFTHERLQRQRREFLLELRRQAGGRPASRWAGSGT